MRLLLDTHVLIWWHEKNPRLRKQVRDLITDTDEVYVSLVSLWEIAIKLSTGRLTLSVPPKILGLLGDFEALDLSFAHAQKIMELPWLHRDPFDRMLVAQAQCENLHLVTDDKAMLHYDMKRIEF